MAGFEVIVRPVIFPNIRPAPARALAPEDEPDKGIAVLTGSSGKVIDIPYSESASWSKSRLVEQKRRFDVVRTYPTDTPEDQRDDDTPHVDTERVNKMWLGGPIYASEGMDQIRYADATIGNNEEVIERNTVRTNRAGGSSSFNVGGE